MMITFPLACIMLCYVSIASALYSIRKAHSLYAIEHRTSSPVYTNFKEFTQEMESEGLDAEEAQRAARAALLTALMVWSAFWVITLPVWFWHRPKKNG